jgi:hypothetical protein
MLAQVSVAGNLETGKLGIIKEDDTPATAASALAPFARAGNLEALYMYVLYRVLREFRRTFFSFGMERLIFSLCFLTFSSFTYF